MSRKFALLVALSLPTATFAQHPPPVTAINVCTLSGTGGQGSCPAGRLDTHQLVLAPGGGSINTYADAAIADEHSSVFAPGMLGSNADYLFFVAAGGAQNRDIGNVVLSGGTGPNATGQWTLDFPRTDGYGSYSSGFGVTFVEPVREAFCPNVADGNPAHQDQTFDMEYAAPGSVVKDPTGSAGSYLMVYESVNRCVGNAGGARGNPGAYLTAAIATSMDYGKTWPTYRGTSTFSFVNLPLNNLTQGPNVPFSAFGPNVCIGNDCTTPAPSNYGRYQILSPPTTLASLMAAGVPLTNDVGAGETSAFLDDASANPAQYLYVMYGGLYIARAAFAGGAPLSFQKWNGTTFAASGLGGADVSILPAGPFQNCEAAAQTGFGQSISYVDDTQQYLLLFVCNSPGDPAGGVNTGVRGGAWFWSTTYNLSDQTSWSTPQEIPGTWSPFETSGGCSNYKGWYPTAMSLGAKPGHTTSTGHIFYLWGCQSSGTPPPGRQFSSRQFSITSVVPQSGWWWDPKLNGIGFFLEYGGNSGSGVFLGGFLYDGSGTATWLVSTGPMSGATYSSPWLKVTGGQTLLGPYHAPSPSTNAGNLSITFSDATHAVMTRPDGSQVNLQRFSFTASPTPVAPIAGAPQSGWWWAGSALSGTGYGIEIQGSNVFIVAYVYDNTGNPIWYLSTGSLTTPTTYTGNWSQYKNGPTLTSPECTSNCTGATAITPPITPMSLTFSDATHGTLTMGAVSTPIVRFQSF